MGYQEDVRNDDLTDAILNRAVEVHRALGPNQPEQTYRDALELALDDDGYEVASEVEFSVSFRGRALSQGRADLVVEDQVVLELKVVKRTTEHHFQQLGRNVRGFGATRGLLLNFGEPTLDSRRYVDGYEPDR